MFWPFVISALVSMSLNTFWIDTSHLGIVLDRDLPVASDLFSVHIVMCILLDMVFFLDPVTFVLAQGGSRPRTL